MESIRTLPNIGAVLADKLELIGIVSYDDLCSAGSIGALEKIHEKTGDGCLNMLFALEGAIRKIRWHDIPKEERDRLKIRAQTML